MSNSEVRKSIGATIDGQTAQLEDDIDMGRMGLFYLKLSEDRKLCWRKRSGVQYGENGRAMTVLKWDPKTRALAFKRPGNTSLEARGLTFYHGPEIIICLLGKPEKDGWAPAWTLAEWDHKQGTYKDPETKERER